MPARLALSSVILLGVAFGSVGAGGGADKPPAKQGREEIDRLIDQLKSDKFKVREEATRRLMECDDALPALEQAAKSDNAEVAGRARKALEAIKKRLAKRALRRATAMLKKGQTDQFVEQVVRWRDYMDEDCWKAAVEHVEAIADKASKMSEGQFKLAREVARRPKGRAPWVDVTKLPFIHTDHLKLADKNFIREERIIAESVTVPDGSIHDSFILCAGMVTSKYSLGGSVVFANGSLRIGDQENTAAIGGCIVVCDGDVDISGQVGGSVILARGNVKTGAFVKNSVIISGGDLKVGLTFKDAFIRASVIQKHQRDPLNLIHFFDPTQVGVEVKSTKGRVWVEALAAAKPFAQAGVRKGDQIVAVGGVKVDSAKTFRRLVRQCIQESKPILLEIRREENPLRVEVRASSDAP